MVTFGQTTNFPGILSSTSFLFLFCSHIQQSSRVYSCLCTPSLWCWGDCKGCRGTQPWLIMSKTNTLPAVLSLVPRHFPSRRLEWWWIAPPRSHYVVQVLLGSLDGIGHCLPLRMTSPLCSLSTPASLRHPLGGQVCSGKPHLPSPVVRSTKSQESKLRAQERVLKKEVWAGEGIKHLWTSQVPPWFSLRF